MSLFFQHITALEILLEQLTGDTVRISVGSDAEIFSIHRKLLCYYSRYFTEKLSTAEQGCNGLLSLPNIEPLIFKCLVLLFYTKEFDRITLARRHDGVRGYMLLYALAVKLGINAVSIISMIRRDLYESATFFNNEEISYAYLCPDSESTLRDMAVELTAYACLTLRTPVEIFRPSLKALKEFNMDFLNKVLQWSVAATMPDPRDQLDVKFGDSWVQPENPFANQDGSGVKAEKVHSEDFAACTGSGKEPFRSFDVIEGQETGRFQSLSCVAPYDQFSFEELRLADYEKGHRIRLAPPIRPKLDSPSIQLSGVSYQPASEFQQGRSVVGDLPSATAKALLGAGVNKAP